MPALRSSHVEVYLFRRTRAGARFLALRRSPGRRLGGVWQPVTGKLLPGEGALAAAMRETLEETGLAPRRWWALETLTLYYDPAEDAVFALPLFAAEAPPRARVELSREHDAHAWLTAPAAGRRFLWDAQRRGLEAVRREVLRGGPLAEALELTGRPQSPRRARRAPGGRNRS